MNTGERRRVTVADTAEESGVSVPTVSRLLNGRTDVAPETRTRIEELLRCHEYRRRGVLPKGGRASLIGVVFDDLDSPWAVEIIRGVEEELRRHLPTVVVDPAGVPSVNVSTIGATNSPRNSSSEKVPLPRRIILKKPTH